MDRRKINKINYSDEYKETINKKAFIKLVLKRYPKLKESSALRRWYDCKKVLGEQKKETVNVFVGDKPIKEPGSFKMLELEDMKRLGYKLTKSFLRTHGFSYEEINWLEREGEVD